MGKQNQSTESNSMSFGYSHNLTPYAWAPAAQTAKTPSYTFMGKDLNDKTSFQDYVNAVYEPQKQQLTDTYYSNTGSAINNANSMGTLNSLGFQNYRTNQLDKNYANALQNAYNQAQLSANEYLNNLRTQDFQNQYQNAAMLNDYIANSYNNYNSYNSGNKINFGLGNENSTTTSGKKFF